MNSRVLLTSLKRNRSGEPAGPFLHRGHLYHKEKLTDAGSTYYICAEKRLTGCHARLIVFNDGEVELRQQHNHYVDGDRVNAKLVKEGVRHDIISDRSVRDALSENQQGLDIGIIAHLPKAHSFVSFASKIRAKTGFARRPEPNCMANVQIPMDLVTRNNEILLLRDSGDADTQRFLLFGSRATLQFLTDTTIWLADGTFAVPQYVRQLWIVHAVFKKGGAVPCVFAVMSSKTSPAYVAVLNAIKAQAPTAVPQYVVLDFETAERTAVKSVFPNSTPIGCWFHLAQSIMRKEKELKLLYHYLHNIDQILYTRALWALSMIPYEDIPDVFAVLKLDAIATIREKTPEIEEPFTKLYDYFERNYIADNALFKPSFWTWFDARKNMVPRTTSDAEIFHRQLNTRINRRKASVGLLNDVIPAILSEIGFAETRGVQKKIDPKRRGSAIASKEARIHNMMDEFDISWNSQQKVDYVLDMVKLLLAIGSNRAFDVA